MDIFYFILFGAVGAFCLAAAVKDWKWFIDYWSYQNGRPGQRFKSRGVLRFLIGAAGGSAADAVRHCGVGWVAVKRHKPMMRYKAVYCICLPNSSFDM